MDTQQMFQELDRLYAQGKLDEAEEKMMGWMKEGLDSGNKSLCLMMCNEMEGLYGIPDGLHRQSIWRIWRCP
mgnify:FL=1